MRTYINGQERELDEGSTIAALIETLALDLRKVAVEVNEAIVPRSQHGQMRLSEGDRIEIVQFIGGG